MSTITMEYGSYSFSPVPSMSLDKRFDKTNADVAIGTTFVINLNGNIVLTDTADWGLINTVAEVRDIREAFDRDGKYFRITCDGTTVIECYPRIINDIQFQESSSQWVNNIPYTIQLEFDIEPVDQNISGSGENVPDLMPPFVKSFDENWNIEFLEDNNYFNLDTTAGESINPYSMRLTHTLNAQGKTHWDGPGTLGTIEKPAWQQARDFIIPYLGADNAFVENSGVINVPTGDFGFYDHARVAQINESDGSYGVTETWTLINNSGGALNRKVREDFNVTLQQALDSANDQISIQGSIQGLEERDYGTTDPSGFTINASKYENASGYWASIKDGLWVFPRAQAIANTEGMTLNIDPLTKQVVHSPAQGIINYSYQYDTRPTNCISGAKTENITVSDNNPTDIFTEITVLGREKGPILQCFNTVSKFSRQVSIEAIMSGNTGCGIAQLLSGNKPTTQVNEILCLFETELQGNYADVFKENDSESWNPKTGRYARSVTWSAGDPTVNPNTSVC